MAFFLFFPQIGALVLPISPEQIKLGCCACAQIGDLEEGNNWFYLDDARDLSERGRIAASLVIDGSGPFCPFFGSMAQWFQMI